MEAGFSGSKKNVKLTATPFNISEVKGGIVRTQCEFKVSAQLPGCDGGTLNSIMEMCSELVQDLCKFT